MQVSGAIGSSNTIDLDIPQSDSGYSPATGVWTISPSSALPTVATNAAIINGYSQPGASANTLAQGDNAKVLIDINGPGRGNGLTIDATGSQVWGLAIGNCREGIELDSGGSVVTGDFIGTDPSGEIAEGNSIDGIQISSSNNTVGGTAPADRNIVSGNTGVYGGISDYISNQTGPVGNLLEGNYIGTDASGTMALPNAAGGVGDAGTNDTIGGTGTGAGNLISGNGYDGISANFGSITIEGNFIGTDVTGNGALGNGAPGYVGEGIAIQASDFATAGATTISENVVSGNSYYGISVASGPNIPHPSTFRIDGNLIGTNAAGNQVLGNGGDGLVIGGISNSSITGNVASGNGRAGIDEAAGSANDLIQGNFVGTDKTGTLNLGNHYFGVTIEGTSGGFPVLNTTIGGSAAGAGNVIAFNGGGSFGGGGVLDSATTGVLISRNSIFANLGPGISSPNPPAPVLTFLPDPNTPGFGTLSGTLTAAKNTEFTIEIFSNATVPTHGDEQGQTYVTSVTVNTDANGLGSFSVPSRRASIPRRRPTPTTTPRTSLPYHYRPRSPRP